MAEEMPAIGTRAVHKDDHAKSIGPVWEVKSTSETDKEVKLNHVPSHKMNKGLVPETRKVKVPDFHKDYVQL